MLLNTAAPTASLDEPSVHGLSLAGQPAGEHAAAEAVDLDDVRIDPAWALRMPAALAMRKRILPLCRLDGVVQVACLQPAEEALQRSLRNYLGGECAWIIATPESLTRALARVFDTGASTNSTAALRARTLDATESDPSDAVALCEELLQAAWLRGASDIHLLPGPASLSIQFRVDGHLEPYRDLPPTQHATLLSRLKVLAGMDIAEKRAAQDGRITAHLGPSRRLDLRAATLPTRYGERMTLRLLSPHAGSLTLSDLGLRDQALPAFSAAMQRPNGLILLTGPTGSGKSTTLYVAIEELLRTRGGNVITIEDPVEYEIAGASQVEIDSADKVNFSKALRSMLRHDPDVLMIGEIRDRETAEVAVKASLTGHLVFSTLHTNTAAGVVTRLTDLGVEPFLIAATLRLAVAQRLVRRLCSHCRRPVEIDAAQAQLLRHVELAGATAYTATGCLWCAGRGFTGRVALFELLSSNEQIAQQIASGVGEEQLTAEQRSRGAGLLLDDGIAKILDGTTTVAEVTQAVTLW
jgi:general secretion pathway protein E